MIGVDPRFVHVSGALLRCFPSKHLPSQHGVALPAPLAADIGTGPLESVKLQTGAGTTEVLVGLTLGKSEIGGLVSSPVAIAPLGYAQELTAMTGRVTRIFVQAKPGQASQTKTALARIAAETQTNLEPANFDSTLFRVAATPENQGETLFSAISALVGFMFALNAMLLTVPSRRRLIEDICPQGASNTIILQILIVDALVLGVLACAVGLFFGELLSVAAFNATPGYLSSAFPIGNDRIVTFHAIGLAVAAGFAAALGGVLWPVRDLFTGSLEQDANKQRHPKDKRDILRVGAGFVCLGVTSVILAAHRQSALIGSITLLLALICFLPYLFDAFARLFEGVQGWLFDSVVTELAVNELRNPRIRVRSLAIALTAAIAVFGAVSVGGTQTNLQHGLQTSAAEIDSAAEVWVAPRDQAGILTTTPFHDISQALRRVRGVRSVGAYRGSFLDWGSRRLWVLAPSVNTPQMIPWDELVEGNLRLADERLRAGGWVVLSSALASEHHLHIGDHFTLPTPRPAVFCVAAISTNLGWPPGSVILNSDDYTRVWGSAEPSAYQLQLAPGTSLPLLRRRIREVAPKQSDLTVESVNERQHRHFTLISQGLSRLTQITLLVLIAGALAVAGAIGSMLWQRRSLIAFMKVDGYPPSVLWCWLVCESALILAAGCLAGALFGLYGQLLNSYALASVTGLPISLSIEAIIAAISFAAVSVIALGIVAVPGYLVVRVPPSTVSPAY